MNLKLNFASVSEHVRVLIRFLLQLIQAQRHCGRLGVNGPSVPHYELVMTRSVPHYENSLKLTFAQFTFSPDANILWDMARAKNWADL